MAPATHAAPAPTAAQHQHAVGQSDFYVDSLATLPQSKKNKGMFSAAAPSQLSAADTIEYGKQYNLLAEALNRPAGTSNHFSGDQASWARKALWVLWFRARDIAAEGDDEEGEDNEEEDEEEEENAEDKHMEDD